MTETKKTAGGLSAQVYHQIRSAILEGGLISGESVTELGLAKDCGVSRTPVREALRQLELEGLVELIPNKGAIVLGISPEDIRDIYEMRAMLEGAAAARAAQHSTDEQVRKLSEVLDLTEFYAARRDMPQLKMLDGRFHQLIYEMSGSRMYRRMLRDLHYYVSLTGGASLQSEGRAAQSAGEHRAVLEAVMRHDSEDARRLMTLHVNNALQNVLKNVLKQRQQKT